MSGILVDSSIMGSEISVLIGMGVCLSLKFTSLLNSYILSIFRSM